MSLLQENPKLRKYVEDQVSAFAMFCDTSLLTAEEGVELAEELTSQIEWAAEERPGYTTDDEGAS